MHFKDKLAAIQKEKKSLLCIGLDPEIEKLPPAIGQRKDAIYVFCREIINATAAFAAAYKINFAFFERFGAEGWQTMEKIAGEIPAGCLSIADAKRGDIGNSAKHYAEAIFGRLGFDAVTANPYMGKDSAEPFLDWKDRAVFFLGLTSNPGAIDFQFFQQNGQPLYAAVAQHVEQWNSTHDNCGLVVGATKSEKLRQIRQIAPGLTFLIPGVGAQGGTVATVLQNIGDSNALISASRSIIYSGSNDDFAEAAAAEARRLQAAMQPFIAC